MEPLGRVRAPLLIYCPRLSESAKDGDEGSVRVHQINDDLGAGSKP